MRASLALTVLASALACGTATADGDKPVERKGTVVTLDGVQSRTPSDWKEEESSNQMRVHQFKVPAAKGDKSDGELVIFFFGARAGTNAENIKRWKEQFVPPEGKTIDDVTKIETLKVGDREVTTVDIHGTYKFKAQPFNPNAKVELRPDYRLLTAIFEGKKGPYFIRFVGPAKTVGQHKKGFEEWLKGFEAAR
jgi:gluconolactonase